jgi:hypothetical protein
MSTDHIMQFFKHDHLPQHLQDVAKPFTEFASNIVARLPQNPERTVALRKLLESKDAAVRAALAGPQPWPERASGPVDVPAAGEVPR